MSFFKSLALNGILIAILAQGLIGISLVWDKVLLRRTGLQNLVSYVFWLGAISIFGLLLIPFGFHMPSLGIAGIALLAGFCDLLASYFYYAALKAGEASEELAAMGGFAPVATVALSIPLLGVNLTGQVLGFALMTLGGFVMFFAEKLPLRKMLPRVIAAAVFFGLTDVLQKIAFNHTKFVSGYVFFTIGTFLGAVALLLRPSWRRQIFQNSEEAPPRSKVGYMLNRFMAGVGSSSSSLPSAAPHPPWWKPFPACATSSSSSAPSPSRAGARNGFARTLPLVPWPSRRWNRSCRGWPCNGWHARRPCRRRRTQLMVSDGSLLRAQRVRRAGRARSRTHCRGPARWHRRLSIGDSTPRRTSP